MQKKKSLYDILQVTEDSTDDVINAAYTVLNKKYRNQHFDNEDERTYLLWELDYAHSVLSDSGVRSVYNGELFNAHMDELISDFTSSIPSDSKSTDFVAENTHILDQKKNTKRKFATIFMLVCIGIVTCIAYSVKRAGHNYVFSTATSSVYPADVAILNKSEDSGADVSKYFSKTTPNSNLDPYDMFVDSEMVWITAKGKRYHSNSSCSNMIDPEEISLSDAEDMGYTPCQKCH